MNRHLTEEQIAGWVIGEKSPEMVTHVAECAACHGQVSDLEQTLSVFRESMHGWAAEQEQIAAARVGFPARRRSVWVRPLRWAAATVAVALMVSVPTYRIRVEEQQKIEQAKQDAALLQQVDDEVSQTVPDAMEPLTKLIAWDGSSNSTNTDTNNDSEGEN